MAKLNPVKALSKVGFGIEEIFGDQSVVTDYLRRLAEDDPGKFKGMWDSVLRYHPVDSAESAGLESCLDHLGGLGDLSGENRVLRVKCERLSGKLVLMERLLEELHNRFKRNGAADCVELSGIFLEWLELSRKLDYAGLSVKAEEFRGIWGRVCGKHSGVCREV